MRAFWLWGILLALWMVLSGPLSIDHGLLLGLGLVTCTLAVWIVVRMGILDRESLPLHLLGRGPGYLLWLIWEIFRSNLRVASIILSPRLRLDARVVHFQASQRTDLGRFIYANSITLTPGTVTTGIVGDDLEVHALVGSEVDGSEENDMNRRVAALEGASDRHGEAAG